MRSLAVGLITLLLLGLGFQAVAADQAATATFKGQSNLVLIPTVVHDKSGAHIPNLTKDDFTVTSDGQKRVIAVFEEVRPGDQRMQKLTTSPDEFTNLVNGELRPSRLTVIALDTVTSQELRQEKARADLLRVLAKMIHSDSMVCLTLITTTGTRVVQDFTADPKILLAALNKVVGSEPIARETRTTTEEEALWDFPLADTSDSGSAKAAAQVLQRYYRGEFERKTQEFERRVAIMHELDALEQIGQSLRGFPGRKSLLWVGGGFPFSLNGAPVGIAIPSGADAIPAGGPAGSKAAGTTKPAPVIPPDPLGQLKMMLPVYQRVWKILNDANIAIYGIDVRGLTTTGDAASIRYSSPNEQIRQRWLSWDTQDTFRVFADVTGGRAYTNMNDLDKAYRESMDDQAAYYMVGYYIDRKKDKPGWHDLSVKVNRQGAEIRSRNGFVLRTAEDKATAQDELEVALRSPLDYTGLPMMGHWVGESGGGAKRKVAFSLLLPPGVGLIDESAQNHLDLDFYVSAQDAGGKTVAHASQEMEGRLNPDTVAQAKREGIRYESSLDLPPGVYTVHFVVRDRLTDRIGSVMSTLKVGGGANGEAK